MWYGREGGIRTAPARKQSVDRSVRMNGRAHLGPILPGGARRALFDNDSGECRAGRRGVETDVDGRSLAGAAVADRGGKVVVAKIDAVLAGVGFEPARSSPR